MSSPPKRALEGPRDLTIPEPGSTTARRILSLAIGQVIADLAALSPSRAADPKVRTEAAEVLGLVRRLARENPGPVAVLARDPTVSTLVRCLVRLNAKDPDPLEANRLLAELSTLLCFDLTHLDVIDATVRLTRLPGRIVSLTARRVVTLPESTRALVFSPDGVTLEDDAGARPLDPDGPLCTRPYHPVDDDLVLAVADNNPLSMFEAHPDKQGNAIDLGGRPPEAWTSMLRRCLDLVGAHLPELREEIRLVVRQIVPVGYDPERHLSASYQEDIGTIYMTLHPQLMTMTEALVHELSHNKLNALFELDGLLENAFHPLYRSPVRPDPRPLHGVLLAVHAFLPIARLYERMLDGGDPLAGAPGFEARYHQIVQTNREGAEVVLGNGRATPVGAPLLDEIRRWDSHYAETARSGL